jgi:ATP-dependent Lon protease
VAEFSRTPLRIPPLLLAGPPGVGKTHFALRLSEILGVPKFVYPLESAETVAALCGSDRHWANSEPGELYKLIVQGEYANPVVVLDEIDKANPGSSYRPTSALHAVLEPITASKLRDKSIQLEFDASFVVYIATANRLSPIETSLVSRFELFHIELPGPRGAVSIARSIGHQAIKELRLEKRFAAPAGEVVQQLALIGCPRRMLKALKAAIGRAVLAGRRWLAVRDLVPGDGNDPLQ